MLECINIGIKKNKKLIIDNINLSIKNGEKILLKGVSGSGKTSLIRSMLFFEKFTGCIKYNNEDVFIGNITEYRNNIGYVGQKIPDFHQTVGEFLKIPESFKLNKSIISIDKNIIKYLDQLNFEKSILKTNFSSLSGGEKQRIAVLGVILLNKPIYIFDEITSALDQKNIESLISFLMNNISGTVISISHNTEWEKFSTRVIEMKDGGIIEDRYI